MAPVDFLRKFPIPTKPLADDMVVQVAQKAVEAAMKKVLAEAANKGLTELEARDPDRTRDYAQPKEKHGFLLELLKSEGDERYLGLGIVAFAPWTLPLSEAAGEMDLSTLSERLGLDFSISNFKAGMKAYSETAKKRRDEFEQKLEGAIQNPRLEDLNNGNLFVLDEEGLNNLLGELMAQGGKQKVRNLKVTIDDMDRLKISGEYDHWSGWWDFTAVAEFEQVNGKSEGFIKKIEAVGMDLTEDVEKDILNALTKYGFEAPEGASIKDLSWINIPGMKRIQIDRGRIILEREPSPAGPS